MLSVLTNTDAKGTTTTLAINSTRNFSTTILDKTGIISVGNLAKEVGLDIAQAIADVLLHAQRALERNKKKMRLGRRQFSSLVSSVQKLPEAANLIPDLPKRGPGRPRKNPDPVANQSASAPAVAPNIPPAPNPAPAASVPGAVGTTPGTPEAPAIAPIHVAKRNPGRPRKEGAAASAPVPVASANAPVNGNAPTAPKRGPGRPRKNIAATK